MNQCVQEHKSLWRIRDEYIKDAKEGHAEFWQKMVKDKEEHIAELTELIKAELSS